MSALNTNGPNDVPGDDDDEAGERDTRQVVGEHRETNTSVTSDDSPQTVLLTHEVSLCVRIYDSSVAIV